MISLILYFLLCVLIARLDLTRWSVGLLDRILVIHLFQVRLIFLFYRLYLFFILSLFIILLLHIFFLLWCLLLFDFVLNLNFICDLLLFFHICELVMWWFIIILFNFNYFLFFWLHFLLWLRDIFISFLLLNLELFILIFRDWFLVDILTASDFIVARNIFDTLLFLFLLVWLRLFDVVVWYFGLRLVRLLLRLF